jgi:hypothetical protein
VQPRNKSKKEFGDKNHGNWRLAKAPLAKSVPVEL